DFSYSEHTFDAPPLVLDQFPILGWVFSDDPVLDSCDHTCIINSYLCNVNQEYHAPALHPAHAALVDKKFHSVDKNLSNVFYWFSAVLRPLEAACLALGISDDDVLL
ncbi:hypothetical protein H4R20_002689, partial [Coemansia guatemalensis]